MYSPSIRITSTMDFDFFFHIGFWFGGVEINVGAENSQPGCPAPQPSPGTTYCPRYCPARCPEYVTSGDDHPSKYSTHQPSQDSQHPSPVQGMSITVDAAQHAKQTDTACGDDHTPSQHNVTCGVDHPPNFTLLYFMNLSVVQINICLFTAFYYFSILT